MLFRSKVKRVGDVVEVFRLIRKEIPAKLLLIGDGPERHAMEALARSYDIHQHIRFLGKQEQMEDILPIGDLFLLTSEYESFGLAALEAMAAGVPVVSTNSGGLPEINDHGITGYMSDVGDVNDMAKNAVSILSKIGRAHV